VQSSATRFPFLVTKPPVAASKPVNGPSASGGAWGNDV
jgi:hypothetical protein